MADILASLGEIFGLVFLICAIGLIPLYIYLRAKGVLGEPAGEILE
jgi:hypothetical protein